MHVNDVLLTDTINEDAQEFYNVKTYGAYIGSLGAPANALLRNLNIQTSEEGSYIPESGKVRVV